MLSSRASSAWGWTPSSRHQQGGEFAQQGVFDAAGGAQGALKKGDGTTSKPRAPKLCDGLGPEARMPFLYSPPVKFTVKLLSPQVQM